MNTILESYLKQIQNVQTETHIPISSAFRARAWRLINKMAKSKEEANKMWNGFVTKYRNLHIKSK